ncbi:Smr/MutS family protein [Sphingosinicella rhizophila]|uniref:Smr/MutS family protein n=1 Tax=Sphingosinicella rhizophila TaxID=3050082 RepID=A0ABU3QA39_9SPHN|nr:Smr/MutS family protein [Sphingosinicella sp. GR2756]MDT9599989.1 Smr/MutS family protein [Sphingosinicella sp. GR2756]
MRRLSPEEGALWARVVASVRPLHPHKPRPEGPAVAPSPVGKTARPLLPPPRPARIAAGAQIGTTLDASWDRRLARGLVEPDFTVDLHGHNLHAAYRQLDDSLARAIAGGARLILLITGKPPRGEPPATRGKIRAAVGDWLAASPHASNIAAVRGAHRRHGGTGALYIVLRRRR